MAISNSEDFTNISQEIYATNKSWTLTSGNGIKKICVKFYISSGESSLPTCAKIELKTIDTPSQNIPIVTPDTVNTTESEKTIDQLIALTNYKERSDNVVKLQDELKDLGFLSKDMTLPAIMEI
jgi:hypothetical protein